MVLNLDPHRLYVLPIEIGAEYLPRLLGAGNRGRHGEVALALYMQAIIGRQHLLTVEDQVILRVERSGASDQENQGYKATPQVTGLRHRLPRRLARSFRSK